MALKQRAAAPALCCGILAVFTAFSPAVNAQTYPAKPVRIVVPFAAGGGTDVITRHLATGLTESLKRQFIVDNRAGANAIVGTEVVSRSPADGYTLLFVSSPHMVNPSMYAKLPYDTLRDFAPVSRVASSPYFLVVHPSLPARNVREFIALAKKQPDQILYGSGGTGSFGRIDLATKVTTRVLRSLPAAHGIAFDPYTDTMILTGATHVTQVDIATGTIVADLDIGAGYILAMSGLIQRYV